MKVLLLSDIHSNIAALEAIWKKESDSDVIYCAGDLVDYGPQPKNVLDWIRSHNVKCVKGNHDELVVSLWRDNMRNVPEDQCMWGNHNAGQLDRDDIDFIDALPKQISFSMDRIAYSIQHMYEGYNTIQSLPEFRGFWRSIVNKAGIEKRLIFGHTHRLAIHYLSNEELWLNPGSASYRHGPDDPTKDAHYIIIKDGKSSLKILDYNRKSIYQAVKIQRVKVEEKKKALGFFGPVELGNSV